MAGIVPAGMPVKAGCSGVLFAVEFRGAIGVQGLDPCVAAAPDPVDGGDHCQAGLADACARLCLDTYSNSGDPQR